MSREALGSCAAPASGTKRIHWRLVNNRNPKSYVIQPSKPDYGKQELKKFVHSNQLRYKDRKDPLSEFENLFNDLNLNTDDELLDRAERRDLPTTIQLMWRQRKKQEDIQQIPPLIKLSRQSSFCSSQDASSSKSTKSATPIRRSVVPNVILDDYAFRKFNQNSKSIDNVDSLSSNGNPNPFYKSYKHPLYNKNSLISYLSLTSFDDDDLNLKDSSCDICNGSELHHHQNVPCPIGKYYKYPNLVTDDVLNRRLRQAPGANVSAPQPPFGIPNSPVISFMHTFPQSDYSRVEPDLNELQKQRFRSHQSSPHLINDDMAFRSLRKEHKYGMKGELTENNNISQQTKFASTSNLSLKDLRFRLRPTKSLSSNDSASPVSPAFPDFDR